MNKINSHSHRNLKLNVVIAVVAALATQIFSLNVFAVSPVYETGRHVEGALNPWDIPGKWGPFSSPEEACRIAVWSPLEKYPDNNFRGVVASSSAKPGRFECLCHSNTTGSCAHAQAMCPPGYSSGVGEHEHITPSGIYLASLWQPGACRPILPDPLKPKGECLGNPIAITTGAKLQREIDILLSRNGDTFFVDRYYVLDRAARPKGEVGERWSFGFDARLTHQRIQQDEHVIIYLPTGRGYRFELVNDVWESEFQDGTRASLSHVNAGDSRWVFSQKNITYTFNDQGYLVSKLFPDYEITIDRNEANRIDSVLFGTVLAEFDYYPNGLVKSIKTGGKYVDYMYDKSGRLISASIGEFPTADDDETFIRTYLYEDERFVFALTGIMDETGEQFARWSYDEKGRAVSSEHGQDKESLGLNYSQIDDAAAPRVVATNSLGKETTYNLKLINGMRKVLEVDGHPSANCAAASKEYTYFDSGMLKSKTDWKGNMTTYLRDDLGREISRIEAAGTPDARTITTEYHPTLNKPVKINEPGKVTTMTYDAEGRLISNTTQSTTAP